MNPNENKSVYDDASLVSRFKEDLRVCREALLEAKQRIIVLEQRLRTFLICLVALLSSAIVYGSIQIWQTSLWLHDFGQYVRQERDPRWEKWMDELRHNQDIIKNEISNRRNEPYGKHDPSVRDRP